MFTINDLLTSSGKYPQRLTSNELTPEKLKNAAELLRDVNAFLEELGVTVAKKVSSGFRTLAANSAVSTAKKSYHLQCLAIDIEDADGSLDKIVSSRPDLLRKYNLWQENPDSTPSWAHLDRGTRADRPSRQFSV
jgi:hypothetical protein